MKRILITGSNGNVGKSIVNNLKNKKEYELILTTSKKDNLKEEETYFDFYNKETYKVLDEVDYVFLMRPPHMGDAEEFYPFIDYAKENKIKFIIFLSLMGIEDNTRPPHYKIEKYIESSGISFCFIR
jgi:uncharacterized protein YbjT (DUF2867 family)